MKEAICLLKFFPSQPQQIIIHNNHEYEKTIQTTKSLLIEQLYQLIEEDIDKIVLSGSISLANETIRSFKKYELEHRGENKTILEIK